NYEMHSELVIESLLIVSVKPKPKPETNIFIDDQWNKIESVRFEIPYINFLKREHFTAEEELIGIVKPEEQRKRSPVDVAKNFCSYVYENFAYIKGVTSVETTVDEIWKLKSGVCQDFAH